VFIVLVII